jgi:hypothetical protein
MSTATKDVPTALERVRDLLERGRTTEARSFLEQMRERSTALQDAYGVCLMRCGEVDRAIDLYRRLLLEQGGVVMRPGATVAARTNFATALLLAGNAAGCETMLTEIDQEDHPLVLRLRTVIGAWRRRQGLFRRLAQRFYDGGASVVSLDFPPGSV